MPRYRAQCAEEDRIIEVQQEIASKSKTIEVVQERIGGAASSKEREIAAHSGAT